MKTNPKCYSKTIIIGFMGKDPTYREFPNGQAVCRFDVATSTSWQDKETKEWKERVTWHHCEAWRYLAKRSARFRKGDKVMVEGRYDDEDWEDRKTGEARRTKVLKVQDCFVEELRAAATDSGGTDSDDAPF